MILSNLPSILGTFNPALGTAASILESVVAKKHVTDEWPP